MNGGRRGLIVYGTIFGATKETSEEIARILREEHFDVTVVNANEERLKDISAYSLVVVGSSLAHCKWNGGAEGFLKQFRHDLAKTTVALFVSSVSPIAAREGNSEEVAKTRKIALDDKIAKYGLRPQLVGVFGGVLDFPAMGVITRKAMEVAFKARLQATGFPESRPGVYDLRDWEEIRRWAHTCAHLCDSTTMR